MTSYLKGTHAVRGRATDVPRRRRDGQFLADACECPPYAKVHAKMARNGGSAFIIPSHMTRFSLFIVQSSFAAKAVFIKCALARALRTTQEKLFGKTQHMDSQLDVTQDRWSR